MCRRVSFDLIWADDEEPSLLTEVFTDSSFTMFNEFLLEAILRVFDDYNYPGMIDNLQITPIEWKEEYAAQLTEDS
jgi:hypothetical protein